MKVLLWSFFVIFTILRVSDGLKVLGIVPFTSKSHFAIGNSIVMSLRDVGHEVTVVSPFPLKKPIANYTEIATPDILEKFDKAMGVTNAFDWAQYNSMLGMIMMYTIGKPVIDMYMEHPKIQNLLKSNQKFDICIFEVFALDAFMGLADHFDCTIISYTTFGNVNWLDQMTSCQTPYSYIPHPFGMLTEKMTFAQRLTNTLYFQIDNLAYRAYHVPTQRSLYEKYFPNAKKSFDEIRKSSAIIFVNNHVSSSTPRPYMPNAIEIGGIHVEPAKPLPKDLQDFLDSAKDGAILFSMGSIVKSVEWPVERREALVKSFSKLKQKVLWKYENETLPNKPDNLMISSWIPQRDILAHPNIKLFITHGGLLGTTEAVVEGIPVLGFPVFGDQRMNMARIAAQGYGLTIQLDDINEENVSKALKELLSNPNYEKNAKSISSRFNDRPMTPRESVVYWTEYAVRHKGATHLQAAGNSLNFIELYLIDVYLFLSLIAFVFLYLGYVILKFIIKKIFKKKSVGQSKIKKN